MHNDKEVYDKKHEAEFNSDKLNRAFVKASKDTGFIEHALTKLEGVNLPAYKKEILDYLRRKNVEDEVISLFANLNGYRQFNDTYEIRKAVEQFNTDKKIENQISEESRKSLHSNHSQLQSFSDMGTNQHNGDDLSKGRYDYPEVSATATSEYRCTMCGKEFQARTDLLEHERFESLKE